MHDLHVQDPYFVATYVTCTYGDMHMPRNCLSQTGPAECNSGARSRMYKTQDPHFVTTHVTCKLAGTYKWPVCVGHPSKY